MHICLYFIVFSSFWITVTQFRIEFKLPDFFLNTRILMVTPCLSYNWPTCNSIVKTLYLKHLLWGAILLSHGKTVHTLYKLIKTNIKYLLMHPELMTFSRISTSNSRTSLTKYATWWFFRAAFIASIHRLMAVWILPKQVCSIFIVSSDWQTPAAVWEFVYV